MDKLPKHLGGHGNKTHLDEGTIDFLINKYNIKSYLDIGCGPAGMVELAHSKGLDAYGIDGDSFVERPDIVKNKITIHDYTTGPSNLNLHVDLVWSVEFVEHVYEKYQDNYMNDFQRGKYVLMSFAPVGKKGHHHVNCNTEEYWIETFDKYGFNFDRSTTENIRANISTMGKAKPNKVTGIMKYSKAFVRQNGMFFVRK